MIVCSGWLNPGEEDQAGAGLLYRFWSRPKGTLDTQLLYYGTDPYTPDSLFRLGPENKDFYHDVIVRIANPIGEFVEKWLKVQVRHTSDFRSCIQITHLYSGVSFISRKCKM